MRIDGESQDAHYWWHNVRSPVRFHQAIAALLESEPGAAWTVIEIGPHPILQAYIRQTGRTISTAVRPIGAMARQADGADRIDAVADEAFCLGAARDPEAVGPERGDVVDLPIYPWRRDRYWYKRTDEAEGLMLAEREGALLGFRSRTDAWTWDAQIDTDAFPFLADHRVGDAAVFPAAGYIAILLEAAAAMAGPEAEGPFALEDFEIRRPLVLDDERSTMVRVVVAENGRADVLARPRLMEAPWSLHARARIIKGAAPPSAPALDHAGAEEVSPEALYGFARDIGLDYGPAFRSIEAIEVTDTTAMAALSPPAPPHRG
ncbi:MAG: polyketide synthase dehydratase domain-containing protein, partial [Alphaproteobacteria bacterium]